MRFLAGVALAFVVGCASPGSAPADASVDLAGHCDSTMLFASCSTQCHEPVCVVTTAMCVGSDWVCDCTAVQACGVDMRVAD
jgi:hypothetical protein